MNKMQVFLIGSVCAVSLCSTAMAQSAKTYVMPNGSVTTVKVPKGMTFTDQDLKAIADLDRKSDERKAEELAWLKNQSAGVDSAQENDPQKKFRDRYVERAYTAELARQAEYGRRSIAYSERNEIYNERLKAGKDRVVHQEVNLNVR